jgi:ABC-type spermidine/putrescine transport system permease subunit II
MTLKPYVALAGWTLFVWGNRIRNIVRDEGWVTHWRMAVAVAFVVVALCLLASVLLAVVVDRGAADRGVAVVRLLGSALAVVGSIWWIVRDLGILLADHSVPFKVVHTVLAAITVALSVWVFRPGKRLPSAVYG